MARVSGITVERTISGKPIFVRIDLRKHAEFIPMLEDKGVLDTVHNVNIPHGYMSIKEFRTEALNMVDKLCDEYGID